MKDEVIAVVVLVIAAGLFIGGYVLGHHEDDLGWQLKADKQLAAAVSKANQATQLSGTLMVQKAKDDDQIKSLQQQIINQPVKEKLVYVHPKPTKANPTPAPQAVTYPVFVTAGSVSLYNGTLGLSTAAAAGPESLDSAGDLPSDVTVSRYEDITLGNNAACLQNTQELNRLLAYARGLVKIYGNQSHGP